MYPYSEEVEMRDHKAHLTDAKNAVENNTVSILECIQSIVKI